ncbi:uncharacterized protein ACDP82_003838 [Pangshura tecta]
MAEDDADREEYDEEAEDDDLAESTQHSVSPNSQELFVTQELASHPSQDNEAMEDTSAANFSRLPTPSQRLSKIRRRKKTTQEEMFSDIMEVTSKERAHLNEWKEVVSKYRKNASECEDRRDTRDERWRQEDQRWQDTTLGLLRDQTDMLRRLLPPMLPQHVWEAVSKNIFRITALPTFKSLLKSLLYCDAYKKLDD